MTLEIIRGDFYTKTVCFKPCVILVDILVLLYTILAVARQIRKMGDDVIRLRNGRSVTYAATCNAFGFQYHRVAKVSGDFLGG